VRLARRVGQHVGAEHVEQRVERGALLGRRRGEPAAHLGRHAGGDHRLVAQRRQVPGDEVGHLPAERLHRRVVELERRARLPIGHTARHALTGERDQALVPLAVHGGDAEEVVVDDHVRAA
jgi:hypothetical protein